jgi:hypothetical protein
MCAAPIKTQANTLLKCSNDAKNSRSMKKAPLFILLIISFAISRLVFFLINDPEGPNLLVVSILAMLIFVPISLVYLKTSKIK